ncbi:MAG: hypothetical protein ABUK01_00480 [Leptospirales bacterium]
MKKQLEQRLETLKSEFSDGQKQLMELQNQETSLKETLLRISGAIQVLEEEINGPEPASTNLNDK